MSCERVFSSAGITIIKRRNQLKPDVVEALQTLKFAFKHALWFKDVHADVTYEEELENAALEDAEEDSDVAGVDFALELDDDCYDDE